MKIKLFDDGCGVIVKKNPFVLKSSVAGTLYICGAEIKLPANEEVSIDSLGNGYGGTFSASFVSECGVKYALDPVNVKGGRIIPPTKTEADIAILTHTNAALELRVNALENRVEELANIFDTNSLNFLIK